MRLSSFIIMCAFWFELLIFVSSCSSYYSSAAKIHFSDEDTIKLNFHMTKMGKATHYKIFESHPNGLYFRSGENIASTKVIAKYTQLLHTNNMDIFIFVYINKTELPCDTKKVAELVPYNKTRDAAPKNSCLTTEGCIIKVDWGNKCNGSVEQSAPVGNEYIRPEQNKRKSKEIHDTITIYNGIDTPNQKLLCDEGTNWTITCQTDYQSFSIMWVQKKGTNKIMETGAYGNYSSAINMIISRFDDGTTIQCILYEISNSTNRIASGSFLIEVEYEKNTNFNETTMATSKEVVHYYDFTELSCTGLTYKKWIKLSKEGLIESTFTSEDVRLDGNNLKLPLNLNEADNNSDYMCVGVISSPKYKEKWHYFKREIPSLVHLVFSASEKRTDVLIGYVPVIAGGVGGVIVFLLLVVLIFRCASKKPRSPAPHEVETYACPNTVQYVDLQTIPSNSRRCVTRDDETPYARIVGFLEPKGRRS